MTKPLCLSAAVLSTPRCLRALFCTGLLAAGILESHAQGHLVPNGVVGNLFPNEIDIWNSGPSIVGFALRPSGTEQPSSYPNVFTFEEPLTVYVQVFFVAPNDPITFQTARTELTSGSTRVFQPGVPFYVGFQTGADTIPPAQPFDLPSYSYVDPVFGWAKLENVGGKIQLLDSALEFQGGGIYAGTQTIIPIPEPSWMGLFALGAAIMARGSKTKRIA